MQTVCECKVRESFCEHTIHSNISVESIAHLLSDYLTAETGIHIVFESAIVPKWKDSRICFENVFISRRPGNRRRKTDWNHEGHTEAARLLSAGDPAYHHQDHGPEEHSNDVARSNEPEDPPTDVTYFDINIDNVFVTLSLWRWWNGKGILTDAEVKGVRGVIGKAISKSKWDGASLNPG